MRVRVRCMRVRVQRGERAGSFAGEVCLVGAAPDSGGVVFVDLRQGVKKQAGNVGENRGAACGDLVFGQQLVEFAEWLMPGAVWNC